MLGKQVTKLIIVCDEKTKEYGNYLRQLISVNDDKEEKIVGVEDGTVDAIVWTEEQYKDNTLKISSSEHVLFIGENKTSKSEIGSMPVRFNKFGMSYGWLGKRGMMTVDDTLLSQSEYNDFLNFSATYNQYFEKSVYEDKDEKSEKLVKAQKELPSATEITVVEEKTVGAQAGVVKGIGRAIAVVNNKVLQPVSEVVKAGAEGAYDNIKSLTMKKKMNKQQYRALIVILYLDALQEFLEG